MIILTIIIVKTISMSSMTPEDSAHQLGGLAGQSMAINGNHSVVRVTVLEQSSHLTQCVALLNLP